MDSLEKRRLKLDLVQAYKIIMEIDNVDRSTWFHTQEEVRARLTRQTEFGLDIVRQKVSRSDVRYHSFSQRLINT